MRTWIEAGSTGRRDGRSPELRALGHRRPLDAHPDGPPPKLGPNASAPPMRGEQPAGIVASGGNRGGEPVQSAGHSTGRRPSLLMREYCQPYCQPFLSPRVLFGPWESHLGSRFPQQNRGLLEFLGIPKRFRSPALYPAELRARKWDVGVDRPAARTGRLVPKSYHGSGLGDSLLACSDRLGRRRLPAS